MHLSRSRHQKTTSNFIRISLKGSIRVTNEWSPEELCVFINLWQNPWGGGGVPIFWSFENFSKYWWFQTKQSTRLLEFIKLSKETHCRFFFFSFFFFTIYYLPKLYFGFKHVESCTSLLIYVLKWRCSEDSSSGYEEMKFDLKFTTKGSKSSSVMWMLCHLLKDHRSKFEIKILKVVVCGVYNIPCIHSACENVPFSFSQCKLQSSSV